MTFQDFVNNPVRITVGTILQKKIINNNWIVLDLWSIVHLIVGGFVMLFLNFFNLSLRGRYLWLLGLLVAFEIFEVFLSLGLSQIYIRESLINAVWDVIIGLIGGTIVEATIFFNK